MAVRAKQSKKMRALARLRAALKNLERDPAALELVAALVEKLASRSRRPRR